MYRCPFYIVCLGVMLRWTNFLNVWVFLIPILGLELALFINKNKRFKEKTTYLLLALVGVIGLHLMLLATVDLFFPQMLDKQMYDWMLKIQTGWDTLRLRIGSESRLQELAQTNWYDYLDYLPVFYFGGFIVSFLGCFWRNKILNAFKCPDSLFWATVLSFAIGLLNWEWLFRSIIGREQFYSVFQEGQTEFVKIFMVLSCLYFFQGISVASYLMEKFKITRFWQNLWYILVILNLPMILVFLGLIDFLFEFRSSSKVSN